MLCAWQAFEALGRANVPDRDDRALLEVARRLPDYLAGPIRNPKDPEEHLDKRLSDDARKTAISKAEALRDELLGAVEQAVSSHVAILRMQAIFGDRVPDDASLVSIEEGARNEVRRHPEKKGAAPIVGSVSG